VGLTNLGSESETCVGSRVHLVGDSISFEKNFYRLPFTPPLSGSPYRSFNGIPRLAALVGLEHELWGALELVSSRSSSNARALVVPDSVNLRCLFEPFEGQASNP
jgi:hypothetical protein